METKNLMKVADNIPTFFDDFFKPWNDWFDGGIRKRTLQVPAVNITETPEAYKLSMAVPGMKKEDFHIDMDGNMLSISCEKEETKEEKEKKITRQEYNYSSFSRSFTLPDEINNEKIEARYEDGVLNINLPRKEEAKKNIAKNIAVK